MSNSALSVGMSGMRAYQGGLDVVAHNVANGLTDGFRPRQAAFQENSAAGSGVNMTSALPNAQLQSSLGVGNAGDLATEMVNQLIYQIGFQASTQIVKVSDQMLGTLIDIRA